MPSAGFVLTIARFTLLEALRSRLFLVAALTLAAGVGIAVFLQQVTLTESREIAAAIVAAFVRLAAAFLLAAFVVTSMVRESGDKLLELVLSHPVPRWSYVLGKVVGFSTVAIIVAGGAGLVLAAFAPAAGAAAWAFSLACELVIVAAFSLFCVLTFSHVVAALAAVAGFYLLARSMAAAQIIASSESETAGWTDRIVAWVVDGIAALLPSLDRMTQTAWLTLAPPGGAELAAVFGQTAVYAVLLTAAALFDFYRQEF